MSPNLSEPLSVNCIVTIGWPVVVSKSWRVPESFRSAPVISGTDCGPSASGRCRSGSGSTSSSSGSRVLTPGQTTSPTPHESTTVFGGTPKIFQPFGSLPFSPASSTAFVSSSLAFSVVGPARSFFAPSKRYQASDFPFFTSDCWPASSSKIDSFAIGKPCAPSRAGRGSPGGRRARAGPSCRGSRSPEPGS